MNNYIELEITPYEEIGRNSLYAYTNDPSNKVKVFKGDVLLMYLSYGDRCCFYEVEILDVTKRGFIKFKKESSENWIHSSSFTKDNILFVDYVKKIKHRKIEEILKK